MNGPTSAGGSAITVTGTCTVALAAANDALVGDAAVIVITPVPTATAVTTPLVETVATFGAVEP